MGIELPEFIKENGNDSFVSKVADSVKAHDSDSLRHPIDHFESRRWYFRHGRAFEENMQCLRGGFRTEVVSSPMPLSPTLGPRPQQRTQLARQIAFQKARPATPTRPGGTSISRCTPVFAGFAHLPGDIKRVTVFEMSGCNGLLKCLVQLYACPNPVFLKDF